jgi:hypothetical protein
MLSALSASFLVVVHKFESQNEKALSCALPTLNQSATSFETHDVLYVVDMFESLNQNPPLYAFLTRNRSATSCETLYVPRVDFDTFESLNKTSLLYAHLTCNQSATSFETPAVLYFRVVDTFDFQNTKARICAHLTRNQSTTSFETPDVPLVREGPPREIISVMYASLSLSLLAIFLAMWGKRCSSRYSRDAYRSTVKGNGDRQCKCDGLQKWPYNFFVDGPPVMLQTALQLSAWGLSSYMIPINACVTGFFDVLTDLGGLSCLGVGITCISLYEYLFRTPTLTVLHSLWERIRNGTTSASPSVAISGLDLFQGVSSTALCLWRMARRSTTSVIFQPKQAMILTARNLTQWVRQSAHRPLVSASLDEIREDLRVLQETNHQSHKTDSSSKEPILEVSHGCTCPFKPLARTQSSGGEPEAEESANVLAVIGAPGPVSTKRPPCAVTN